MVEVAPREEILGAGAGGPLPAPTPWLQYQGWIQYPAAVIIGNPTGGQKGIGSLNLQTLYINGLLVNLAQYVLLTGGTMTGFLTLLGDPTASLHAATKQYVDNSITALNSTFANYLPLTGGTLTGSLTLSAGILTLAANPTAPLQAATKQYVDAGDAVIAGIPDAPSDGNPYGRQNAAWVVTNRIDVGTF